MEKLDGPEKLWAVYAPDGRLLCTVIDHKLMAGIFMAGVRRQKRQEQQGKEQTA